MSCNLMILDVSTNTIQVRIHISQTHHPPKTKIGTQREEDQSNPQKNMEKISNIYTSILVIGGQKLILMTFDIQIN